MPLPLIVDSLESISDAAHRSLYVAKDGKFQLDIAGLPQQEDVSGLKSSLAKERDNAAKAEKARKDLEAQFAGIDPVKYRETMSKFESSEEAALIAAGKMDEVINRRTEKLRTELERQVEAARASEEGALEVASTFMERVLDNHVRAAAAKAGLHPSAIEDALFRARTMFELDEQGNAIQTDANGTPILGKDGKTAFGPAEWLESMKETAPHWFPATGNGGGASGDKGASGSNVIKRAAFEAKSPIEKSAWIKLGGKIVD